MGVDPRFFTAPGAPRVTPPADPRFFDVFRKGLNAAFRIISEPTMAEDLAKNIPGTTGRVAQIVAQSPLVSYPLRALRAGPAVEAALTGGQGFEAVHRGAFGTGPIGQALSQPYSPNILAARALTDPINLALMGATAGRPPALTQVRAGLETIAESLRPRPSVPRPGPAVSSIEQTIIQALKEAKPVRAETERLYSASRSQRLGAAMAIGERVPGEAGFRQQLGALKGELPKAKFEPIRGAIGQTEIDGLFDQIRKSPLLSGYNKITAQGALGKIFGAYGGQVPTEGELNLLGRVFSPEFVATIKAKRGVLSAVTDTTAQVIGVPRAIMASMDASAPLRQGVFALPAFPKQWGQSFINMFRVYGSENAFTALKENIVSRPSFDLMDRSGLALTGLDTSILTGREEQFMSTIAERIPGVGRLIHASNRAYTGFLMKLRADAFDEMMRRAKAVGVEQTPALTESTAKFINAATGRGSLGSLELAGSALSTAFFSPRLTASRLNLLNPIFYVNLDPFVRKQALKAALGFAALGTTVLGLAKAGGAQVGIDPRSADFGKIRAGNTRFDVWAGFQQYPRILSQLITGKLISSTTGKVYSLGEGYRPLTRKDIALRFLESKANPAVGFALDLLEGKDFAGQPITVSNQLKSLFVPLVLQDLKDVYDDDPSLLPWATAGFFGVGVQTYGGKKPSPTMGGTDPRFFREGAGRIAGPAGIVGR